MTTQAGILEIDLARSLQDAFADFSGDFSSLHMDANFARRTRFRGPITHGMLPVLLALGRGCYEAGLADGRRLRRLACVFREPARVGDRLGVRFDPDTGLFEISRLADGTLVTSGRIELERRAKAPAASGAPRPMPTEPLSEASLSGPDLSVGLEDEIAFMPSPAAARALLRLLDASLSDPVDAAGFDDANFCAALMASTLIGMRLPGRYATFTELDVTFEDDIGTDAETILRGAIASVARSREHLSLDLTWTQNGRTVGRGTASTLARRVETPSVSASEIRANHLDLGLAGKVALVTGASRGIGQATAMLLAAQGAAVAVHYFRGAADAQRTVDEIKQAGGRALAVGADLSDAEAIARLFGEIEGQFGGVDILVNNAVGDFTPKPTGELTRDDYLAEFEVTLFGAHACTTRALPHMRARQWGKIIGLGTVATEIPVPSQNKYIVAKSALTGYMRSLAVELAADNIQVNMVVPGMTHTSLIASLPSALIERLAADRASGRLLRPIDVAKTVAFLASDWSASISGQQIVLGQGEAPFL